MKNSQSERNTTIIQQSRSGKPRRQIANDFKISAYRVWQIITTAERQEKRRAELENKYGHRPNIAALPDSTPIDVLLLCDAHIQGWAARLAYLKRSSYPSDTWRLAQYSRRGAPSRAEHRKENAHRAEKILPAEHG
jgi:hypothetical protein